MFDIINGSASNLIKIAYTDFNALPDEQWKCDRRIDRLYVWFEQLWFKLRRS